MPTQNMPCEAAASNTVEQANQETASAEEPPKIFLLEVPWGPVVEMNTDRDFVDWLRTLPEDIRPRVQALGQLAATTLAKAVEEAPPAALYAVGRAFASMCTKPSTDATQRAAYDMMMTGAEALCGATDAVDVVRNFHAFQQRVTGADSNTLKIRGIAEEVVFAIRMLKSEDDRVSKLAAAQLFGSLEGMFPGFSSRVSQDDVAALLAAYGLRHERGKRTLEGIVAQLMLRGHLAGARPDQEEKGVLARVIEALKPVRR